MMSWIKNRAYQFKSYHLADMSGVQPEHRIVNGVFYLNSVAGAIAIRPRGLEERCRFRDEFLNRFCQVKDDSGFFQLYRDLKASKFRVSLTANFRTRVRYLWK